MEHVARYLIIFGVVLVVVGGVLLLAGKLPWLGRLPGDFAYKGRRVTFYFPLTTSIILSIILTVLLNLFFRR
ncbi:DUF2905 domain-containing protein [Nitrospinae bacterium AH_259_B05_G02_I21]|nr:DUF2905 domain-containing protein [Nitrospinae bacterium AH_259_B05_G02_I21]MDA2931770.1 DUF2905 domain-containing protein [Nitrospinae bacterium AH-259-F20]